MTTEKIFRILSGILRPVFFLLAFIMLPVLLFSISNPAMLFGIFVFVCVVIYIVKSTQFFRRHIEPGIPAKANMRDWIRVNAFVSIVFVLESFVNAFMVFFKRDELVSAMQILLNRMQEAQGVSAAAFSADQMYGALKGLMIFFLVLAVLLAVHIVCCFKLLKKYRHLLVH